MKQHIPFALAILAIVAACNANNANGPFTGTVKGSVKDTLGDALVNVRVVVMPPGADSTVLHTASDGSWHLENVPLGTGSIQVESLPPDCAIQPAYQYFLESPRTTATLTLAVVCKSRHQVVAGLGNFYSRLMRISPSPVRILSRTSPPDPTVPRRCCGSMRPESASGMSLSIEPSLVDASIWPPNADARKMVTDPSPVWRSISPGLTSFAM
jgi:hypothetical protein